MKVLVLATDNGPHPPEKWARVSAQELAYKLIDIDENSASPKAVEMREARDQLEGKLYAVLKGHHTAVQTAERDAMLREGADRLGAPLHASVADRDVAVGEHIDLDAAVQSVVEEAKFHPELFAHFSKDEVKAVIRDRLGMDFGSVIDIERDWHANGTLFDNGMVKANPDYDRRHPAVAAWQARRHPGPHPSLSPSEAE